MTVKKAWRRRDVLRLGGIAGVAASAGLTRFSLAARAATKPLPVNIVNTASNSTMALQVLLKQQGYFDEVGLTPTTLNVADDPVYFADKYVDTDSVLPADAPFKVEACKELAPEYQQTGRK